MIRSHPAGLPRISAFVLLVSSILTASSCLAAKPLVLVEAESFQTHGGWVLDQQFMDLMGSPFMLAHGLGTPVADAETEIKMPEAGSYRLWVRTRDWVAPWRVPGAPGKFQILLNGRAVPVVFGTQGAEWHWQDGGMVAVERRCRISLRDLTGFEGRCDALLFARDASFVPPNGLEALALFRSKTLGLGEKPKSAGQFDLVVVGGGIAGTCAAVSGARLGLRVALVQDRPVLGGNNSSEVRVWLGGEVNLPPYERVGDIVAELEPASRAHYGPSNTANLYEDDRRIALVRSERNIRLFLNQRVNAIETNASGIRAVIAQNTLTGERTRIAGRLFADCTGDATIGALAGADFDVTDKQHMGPSNLWHVKDTGQPSSFPRCPWAVDLRDKSFPGRRESNARRNPIERLGGWYWESGFDRDPIQDMEWIRDLNLRAMYGAWDTLKNVDHVYPNHKLAWAAYIAGKRESRRLLGDVILSASDIQGGRSFEDGCFPCTWPVDLHTPHPAYQKGHEGNEFISTFTSGPRYQYKKPYWAPYRCLYSRNVGNLFMAGRDISVTHDGLGAVRVMRTGGAMGEIVGMAASICRRQNCSPREIYAKHLDALKALMAQGVGKERTRQPSS